MSFCMRYKLFTYTAVIYIKNASAHFNLKSFSYAPDSWY